MRSISPLLIAFLLFAGGALYGQAPVFDELNFEEESTLKPYKPAGANYVFIRSKRGNTGVNKTPEADAILSSEVTEIVLVFTEMDADAEASREEYNQERWENLLLTYPQLFQFSTGYKNVCQCNEQGDGDGFKKAQGFYVYINGKVPKPEAPLAVSTPPVSTPPEPVTKTEPAPPQSPTAPENPPAKAPQKTNEKAPETAPADNTDVSNAPPPPPPAKKESDEEEEEVSRTEAAPKKKAAVAVVKPRRAKDPKACRPPCYGFGDEDLYNFFKENIPLKDKKEKRKAKNWVANVRVQIHFDGSVKKVMVTGADEAFNLKVQEVMKGMGDWKSAVKGGVAVKSEVRFTLKYDKEYKSMRPYDLLINPRPSPKCQCVTDSEIFSD
jgi:hypothetical protein